MKNICFISLGNLYLSPYMDVYTKHIPGKYSVIYWDREGRQETHPDHTYYRFSMQFGPTEKAKKLLGYWRFRQYAKRVLREQSFDVVIVLQTLGGLLLTDVLTRDYAGKYIVDVRDYTFESNPILFKREKKLIAHSLETVISSPGYKMFLPEHPYLIAHNMRDLPQEVVETIRNRPRERECLNIAFIGYINYQEQHKKLILALKDDPRFRLSFIGTRAKELEPFCDENGVTNVTLIDTFNPKDILDHYRDVDLVHNLYGNHTPVLDYAISNKLYFAAELEIPILVCPDTYMSKEATRHAIGLTVDIDAPDLADTMYHYYQGLDWNSFRVNCARFLTQAHSEQNAFEQKLEEIFNG